MIKNYDKIKVPHQISAVYTILEITVNIKAKSKWEEELNIGLSEESWKDMNQNVHTTNVSPYWREYAWKIQSLYFITLVQQAKYKKEYHQAAGGNVANYTLMFNIYSGYVHFLQTFWEMVQKEISYILRCVVQLNTDYMLLGRTIDTPHEENDNYLIRVLRITVLKQIARNWFQKTPPTIEKWRNSTQQVHQMEYITYIMKGNLRLYEIRWAKWSTYYN